MLNYDEHVPQPTLTVFQPVVNKQTIEPHVVHTTVPVHEVHHNAAQHHATSALPAVSLADFQKQGGVLSGREERYDGFQGEPRSVGGALGGEHGNNNSTGLGSSTGTSHTGMGSSTGTSHTGMGSSTGTSNTGMGSSTGTSGTSNTGMGSSTGASGTTGTHKASLMDKIDPRKDANGDGKAGFMK